MRLLFDNNLSFRLKRLLHAPFPDSAHVSDEGFGAASDEAVWLLAREGGYMLVSKDDDFTQLSLYHGSPPKLILLKLGNASTDTIARVLDDSADTIQNFASNHEASILVLER